MDSKRCTASSTKPKFKSRGSLRKSCKFHIHKVQCSTVCLYRMCVQDASELSRKSRGCWAWLCSRKILGFIVHVAQCSSFVRKIHDTYCIKGLIHLREETEWDFLLRRPCWISSSFGPLVQRQVSAWKLGTSISGCSIPF